MGGHRLEHGDAVTSDRQAPAAAQEEQRVRRGFFGRGGLGLGRYILRAIWTPRTRATGSGYWLGEGTGGGKNDPTTPLRGCNLGGGADAANVPGRR